MESAHEEYERLQKEHRLALEEKKVILMRMREMEGGYEKAMKGAEIKENEFDLLQKEYKKL